MPVLGLGILARYSIITLMLGYDNITVFSHTKVLSINTCGAT